MSKTHRDYFWKEGIPYGISPLENTSTDGLEAYKIVMDPYRKRISIEKYSKEKKFSSVVYDSALFNFRHLKPAEQNAWQKEIIKETDSEVVAQIRNQDDRIILVETYRFEQGLCRECRTHSPHGIFVSRQQIFHTALGDHFNGVVLFDSNQHPVMYKHYKVDESGDFSELISEQWNMQSREGLEKLIKKDSGVRSQDSESLRALPS
jgi:hypothetical protein